MSTKILKIFSYSIGVLAIISCGISVFNNEIYQDGEWVRTQFLGQDMVTLILAAPLLFLAIHKAVIKADIFWKLIFAGVVFYFVYTYAFFVFVTELTFLYFFHLAIFSLSLFSLIIVFFQLFNFEKSFYYNNKNTKRLIVSYLSLISLMLVFLWLKDLISFFTVPGFQFDTPNGEPLLMVYTLDLGIVIPLMLTGVFGFIRKKKFGYILTGVMLVKSTILGFALMAMALSMYIQDLSPDTFLIILWSVLGVAGSILTVIYFKELGIAEMLSRGVVSRPIKSERQII